MTLESLKKLDMPGEPGVYFFKLGKEILYIGKATSLRDRVRSYFASDLVHTRGPGIVDMVFKADTLEWQTTETVLEALILEADLIKSHQPYYNVKEKDGKSWNYVVLTKEVFPRLVVVRGKELKEAAGYTYVLDATGTKFRNLVTSRRGGAAPAPETVGSGKSFSNTRLLQTTKIDAMYGPFTSGGMLREALKIIRRIFPFIDQQSIKKDNYEFYRQLGLTPDVGNERAIAEYRHNIRNIKLFFAGKKQQLVKGLEREMRGAAKRQEFERAGELKRQLFALTHINDIALLKKELSEETDGKPKFRVEAYDIAHTSGKQMVGVMTVITNGVPDKAEYRKFNIMSVDRSNDPAALGEVLRRRLGHPGWDLPQLIVVDGNDVQKNVAEKILLKYGYNIPVVAIVKNEAHKARAFLGEQGIIVAHSNAILLANAEAHRFAIGFHRKKRGKDFLK